MSKWSDEWLLQFKAVLLRCCSRGFTFDSTYSLNDIDIQVQDSHKDLGVVISSNKSFVAHYNQIAGRAYQVLGLIRRSISSMNHVREKRLLYITLVRSQLVYCSPVWRPHLKRDILRLERIQRRATKFIPSDYVSDYITRLSFLDLLPLMYIFELNDILFCVNMLKSPTRGFNILDYIKFSDSCTRSTGARKMVHNLSSNNSSRHFYYNRLPRLWNSLPPLDLSKSTATIYSPCF